MSLNELLVRYKDLIPCKNAFVDTRSPGSDSKENFTIIGPGVSENPNQHVHIPVPHGFNIGGARQPPGCLNSQHSHLTAEVFIAHSGKWRFLWGLDGKDGSIEMSKGDTISLPIHMFRGFENIGNDTGFLFAVLGGDDPGRVTWAPSVFELAKEHGLVLLKGGRLIDTRAGEAIPADAQAEEPPDAEEIARLKSPANAEMEKLVVRYDELRANAGSPLAADGVRECPIITPKQTGDRFEPGPIVGWWEHGFNLRCLRMDTDARLPAHSRAEEEVILMQEGELTLTLSGETVTLGGGDILTLPKGAARTWRAGKDGAVVFVVRGGDTPAAPQFI